MNLTTYQDLIEKRKICNKCGVCEDLDLRYANGKLYRLETALNRRFPTDLLGLWNPLKNQNSLTASILIIAQDFSHTGYFDSVETLAKLDQKESDNITNRNLKTYIESIGIDKKDIHFTNAVLCIKSGKMNAPVKKTWLTNCSNEFLKPLITQYLPNLKVIITLGKVALDAIRIISEDANQLITNISEKENFSSLPGKKFDIHIDTKHFKLYPMFHPGNLGASNASRVNKTPIDLWKAIARDLNIP